MTAMTAMTARTRPTTTAADDPPVLAVDADLGAASWRALGTYVDLRTTPDAIASAVALAVDILNEVDLACSRFRADSDLSHANRAAGSIVSVSPLLVAAVQVALEAADETDGLVDPTLGTVLTAAGYDRTFALVPADDPAPTSVPRPRRDWRNVQVGDDGVCVPPGSELDLGATGKALAADLVALAIAHELGAPALVSVGGDVRVAGPDDGNVTSVPAYPVVLAGTVADLETDGTPPRVRLRDGGLATSSTAARRWSRGGRQWNHLVDPRTGAPADGPLRTVTAWGRTAVAANTASTAAMVLGDAAWPWLLARDVAARLVDVDDRVLTTPAWDASGFEVSE
ncbi:FAD:protein FMN transferase [Nostocoides sp. F2B08]|uniref:FAD:protein FMN transferase n=1 Tax=Nostocoides sp. F2B08 TaxID=2653936 RepID=UPI001D04BF9A|nr:FAD:protein FMN transferase [Tetrasphaera sp. F2B08]